MSAFVASVNQESSPENSLKYSCEQGKRLLDMFGAAVQDLLALHEAQFLAVAEGDMDACRFDILIHYANERKQNAKYAYMTHVEEHGCSLYR